jgi:hypothetical protein
LIEVCVAIAFFILGAVLRPFLSGYSAKKGENLATHEDIDKVLEQVDAVTTRTKNIEARISDDVWQRRKQWELARDVLFDGISKLANLREALAAVDAVLQIESEEQGKPGDPGWGQEKHERLKTWQDAAAAFGEARLRAEMVCTKETTAAFDAYRFLVNCIAAKINNLNDLQICSAHCWCLKLSAWMSNMPSGKNWAPTKTNDLCAPWPQWAK